MKRCTFRPNDIAMFFEYADLAISEEKKIREDIWRNWNECISEEWREDMSLWSKAIRNFQIRTRVEDFEEEAEHINSVLNEMGSSYAIAEFSEEISLVESYFKLVKLRLLYQENCDDVKIKLRTLLKKLKYKRRSEALVVNIKNTIDELGLDVYTKGYKSCDIGSVGIDEMIVLRLQV